jgi:hypothetical protein
MNTFISELSELINKYNLENGSNTPDYVLAEYLNSCLKNYDDVMMARDKHSKNVYLAEEAERQKLLYRGTSLEQLAKVEKSLELLLPMIGRKLTGIRIEDNKLILDFINYKRIAVFDSADNCCEVRHMSTDDDLAYFVGSEFRDLDLQNFAGTEDYYGSVHDMQFLKVRTSKGVFTLTNHNEHNGFYAGFWIVAKEL